MAITTLIDRGSYAFADTNIHYDTSRLRIHGDNRALEPPTDRFRRDGSDREGPPVIDDVDEFLEEVGFDAETSVLTRRQALVLALRERDTPQAVIADRLGTSRANVSSIEGSARDNVTKARETVEFAEALRAPVRVRIDVGTDLYDVPRQVYDACDEVGVKVAHTAPDLMKVISDAAGGSVSGRQVTEALVVGVTSEGSVRVRRSG